MHDLIIRGGTDRRRHRGGRPRPADVAVDGSIITAVGDGRRARPGA